MTVRDLIDALAELDPSCLVYLSTDDTEYGPARQPPLPARHMNTTATGAVVLCTDDEEFVWRGGELQYL